MIPELPFLLSIAGLSGSLAGLAGLVAGLRRGDGLRAIDAFRLREIVEFAFANALLALSMVPLANLLGSVESSVRAVAAAAAVYVFAVALVLLRRLRHADIAMTTWIRIAGALDLVILAAALAAIATGAIGWVQLLLIVLLGRPMVAFLFVLASFEADRPAPPGS